MAIIVGRRDASSLISSAAPVAVPDKSPTEEFAQGIKAAAVGFQLGKDVVGTAIDVGTSIASGIGDINKDIQRADIEEKARQDVAAQEAKASEAKKALADHAAKRAGFAEVDAAYAAGDYERSADLLHEIAEHGPIEVHDAALRRLETVLAKTTRKPVVKQGGKGKEVDEVQWFLNDTGGYLLEPNSVWGQKTQAAAEEWVARGSPGMDRAPEALKIMAAETVATKARRAFKSGKYGDASRMFTQAYNQSNRPMALWNAARSEEMGGNLEKASELFESYHRVTSGLDQTLAREKILELTVRRLPKPRTVEEIVTSRAGITYQEAQRRMAMIRLEPDLEKRRKDIIEVMGQFDRSGGHGVSFSNPSDYFTGAHIAAARTAMLKGVTPSPLAMQKHLMAQRDLNDKIKLSKLRQREIKQRMAGAKTKAKHTELDREMKAEKYKADVATNKLKDADIKARTKSSISHANLSDTRSRALEGGPAGGKSLHLRLIGTRERLRKELRRKEEEQSKAEALLDKAGGRYVTKGRSGYKLTPYGIRKATPDIRRAISVLNPETLDNIEMEVAENEAAIQKAEGGKSPTPTYHRREIPEEARGKPEPTPAVKPTPTVKPTPKTVAGDTRFEDEIFEKAMAEKATTTKQTKVAKIKGGVRTTGGRGSIRIGRAEGKRAVFLPNETRLGGTAAWRNNNPGNLRLVTAWKDFGAIGRTNKAGTKGGMAVFPDEATGEKALHTYIKRFGKGMTIATFFKMYAPKEDKNNPESYAASVAKDLGVSVDTKMEKLPDSSIPTFAKAIRKVEKWRVGEIRQAHGPSVPKTVAALKKELAATNTRIKLIEGPGA